MAQLTDRIQTLKGVGHARAALFEKLGLRTLEDLVTYLPRSYEDRTVMVSIAQLQPGQSACFTATVVSDVRTALLRKGLEVTNLWLADDTGRVSVTYFNQSYLTRSLEKGRTFVFYGTLNEDAARRELVNPVFEAPEAAGVQTRRIVPVYPQTAGLSSVQIGRTVHQALALCLDSLPEVLPQQVMTGCGLPGVRETWQTIHDPGSMADLARARKRLVFEDFFLYSTGVCLDRARREEKEGLVFRDTNLEPFAEALPFTLTGAQNSAIRDILRDLGRGVPMSRLIQGDVGSGKTMVAAAAAFLAARNGVQAAFMVPTEILARQQFETLQPLFARLGIETVLLTGSLPAGKKREALERLRDGSARLAVGTHALLSTSVDFQDLGLVIVDEQHRFGTGQRFTLGTKGAAPHTLVMSATPIPRTLALLVYGELDVSILDEKPPGRQEVQSFLVGEAMRQRINAFIRKQCQAGHQVFIVCPAVEQSETEDLKSAEVWAETLQSVLFPDLSVALLHGQMKGADKDAIMAAFARGEQDILVATTVIEVGVDVPNATLMVIENAERFGLSQLHQLRGRVGRGEAQAYCVLFTAAHNPDTLQRLRAFVKTTDGFEIARADLEQRGPGDFFGSRQHGLPTFRAASLAADLDVFQEARAAAEAFLTPTADQDPVWPQLLRRISALFTQEGVALN